MNEFIEIGEIVEAVSKPVKIAVPKPPIPPAPPLKIVPSPGPGGPDPKVGKQLLFFVGAIAVGALIYYLYKKYKDENSNTRDKS
ncbi:hypothetical protein N9C19_00100 [bacterium]|nr:hypothetical protein [bacterium]